jgi:murein DD-endopeptidase MepM/ murein hydrolase activator NlpD
MGTLAQYAVLALFFAVSVQGELVWPTPNRAFIEGKALETFIQPTASGKLESGLFGCVREGGRRFHEALDLFPIERDARGEAKDLIFSILPGRVVYVNAVSGRSSYGRYVVVRHENESPAFHSLYAHLSQIAPGIKPGARVAAGATLGVMGRSAGGYVIPKSRAHLHFELGLKLSDDFQSWYEYKDFKTANRHGIWNGMNLVSVDPLAFYEGIRAGKINDFKSFLKSRPVAARLRVFTSTTPGFIRDYPQLMTRSKSGGQLVAWDIAFTDFGLPKEWTPRFTEEGIKGKQGDVQILTYAPDRLKRQSCHRVLNIKASGPVLSAETGNTLEKLFGFR